MSKLAPYNWQDCPLERMNLHQLLHLLKNVRQLNNLKEYGYKFSVDEVKEELAKRPHRIKKAERKG